MNEYDLSDAIKGTVARHCTDAYDSTECCSSILLCINNCANDMMMRKNSKVPSKSVSSFHLVGVADA